MRSPEGESGPARETTDRTDPAPDERAGADGRGHATGPPPPPPAGYRPGSVPPPYAPERYPGAPPPAGLAGGPYPGASVDRGAYARPPYPHPGRPPELPRREAPPEGPRRTHRWGLGAFLLAEAVFLGVSLLVSLLLAGPEAGVAALGAALAVPTVLAAGVAVLATRVRGNGPKADLGLVWSWRDVAIGLGFGFGGLVVALVATAVFVSVVGPDVTSAVGDLFGDQRAGPAAALMILLIVVLVAPLCEEILYRGMLWGALEKLGAGPWIAFGVTTLAFALLHFEFTRAPLLLIISIPIGLARLYTGRLLASVVAHQVNNLLPGIALYLALTGALPA